MDRCRRSSDLGSHSNAEAVFAVSLGVTPLRPAAACGSAALNHETGLQTGHGVATTRRPTERPAPRALHSSTRIAPFRRP